MVEVARAAVVPRFMNCGTRIYETGHLGPMERGAAAWCPQVFVWNSPAMPDFAPARMRRSLAVQILGFAVLVAVAPFSTPSLRGAPVDYSVDVRPILAKNCFNCHGADEQSRQADLRLDTPEGATVDLGGRRAIVPGKPMDSEVIHRIFAEDRSEVMPPADSRLQLSAEERELIRNWIRDGAGYDKHWAFIAPRQPPVPEVRDAAWVRNPIDAFILKRLEEEGLQPSPEADRYTLARRAYLDLVGLPPTPAEADAFVNDHRVDAYARLVDRLFASPSSRRALGTAVARSGSLCGYQRL